MRNQYDSAIPNNASANSVADTFCEVTSSAWLTAAEAAQYLKIKTRTILFWARSGRIKAYSLTETKRRVWRFLQSDLDAILRHNTAVLTSSSSSAGSADRRQ